MQLEININSFRLDKSFFRFHSWRVLIILAISYLFVHTLFYNKLPFQPGYTFPFNQFLLISTFGFVVCSANWVTYSIVSMDKSNIKKYVLKRILLHSLTTLLVYTMLYAFINMKSGYSIVGYLKGFEMCMGVVLIEFLFFELIRSKPTVENVQPNAQGLLIPSGKKMAMTNFNEIVMTHLNNGIISVYLKSGQRLITDFNSMQSVESKFPKDQFFRVNRQYIISREAISTVIKEKNRKLSIQIDPTIYRDSSEGIVISRYRSKDFKNWIGNDPY